MQKRVQRYACHFADRILVNADAVKNWLVNDGYDPARIVVIPNGVDLSRFDAVPEPARLRRELGLPGDTPLVAVVSRLTRLKGLEHFLEAAAAMSTRAPSAVTNGAVAYRQHASSAFEPFAASHWITAGESTAGTGASALRI